jgi:D-alanyl-lipoteichoic acid acyltransferase DltB (MBOAT superfamily)
MQVQSGGTVYFSFLAVVFFVYWACHSVRIPRFVALLLANLFFCYQFGPFYALLLPVCASIDFGVGLGLMRFQNDGARRVLLGVSLAVNLGLLLGWRHMGAAALGLSFYAFQTLTYTLDLYRRDAEGTTNLLGHMAAVSFFPTLQAGPITRVSEIVKQLESGLPLSRSEGGRAFFWIASGVLKKALIADFLAENLVNRVFDTPNLYSGAEVLLAVHGYAIQLYFDSPGTRTSPEGPGCCSGSGCRRTSTGRTSRAT